LRKINDDILANIAPTVLDLLGFEKSKEINMKLVI